MNIPLKAELFRLPLPWQLCKDAWFAVNSLLAYLITGLITHLLNSQRIAPLWPGLAGFTLTSPRVPCADRDAVKTKLIFSVCFHSQGKVTFYVPPACFFVEHKGFWSLCWNNFCVSPSARCHGPHAMATPRRSFKSAAIKWESMFMHARLGQKSPTSMLLKVEWSWICTCMSGHVRPFVGKDFIYPTRGKFYIFFCEQFSSFSSGRVVMSHRGKLMWIINIQSWCWSWIKLSWRRRAGEEGVTGQQRD